MKESSTKYYFQQNLNPDLLHERRAFYLCTITPLLHKRKTFETKFKRSVQKGPPFGLKRSNYTSDPIELSAIKCSLKRKMIDFLPPTLTCNNVNYLLRKP